MIRGRPSLASCVVVIIGMLDTGGRSTLGTGTHERRGNELFGMKFYSQKHWSATSTWLIVALQDVHDDGDVQVTHG